MQPKEYQQRALDRFDLHLDELLAARLNFEVVKVREKNPELEIPLPDFPSKAWEALLAVNEVGRQLPYSPRVDGCGRPVPNVTLKVPTGGGKTLLAAACSAKVLTRYLGKNSGFVLWIVPNEAIYSQTKRQLSDRDHPYRQMLDRAAAGRVKLLEKDSPLHRADVESHLCVMLLMLPSANRQTKEQLRLFRDRGNVNGFLPNEGDIEAHGALLGEVKNLDFYVAGEFDFEGGQGRVGIIKSSLGNALRLVRPIVVMDEGHKAFSELAHSTLYDFNPSFVIELSATPRDGDHRHSNQLVNISGEELDREEMIKMPIEVTVKATQDWRDCLRAAWEKTQDLQKEADALRADTQRYIRPILLVQVERTGKEKHEQGYIHAEDARACLSGLGLEAEAIAAKTAEQNELKDQDDQNLLSPANPVRAIITKQALQEGWDCPFAYVLCTLAPGRSLNALTQLLGRVLRQPDASRTGRTALDRCYVFCYRAETGNVIESIREGLKQDGMGDLQGKIVESGGSRPSTVKKERRLAFRSVNYYLPKVLTRESAEKVRLLDWETDILPAVDWTVREVERKARELQSGEAKIVEARLTLGLNVVREPPGKGFEVERRSFGEFDRVFAVRALAPFIANPWVARPIVDRYLRELTKSGWTAEQVSSQQPYIIDGLVNACRDVLDDQAEALFEKGLKEGRFLFRLTTKPWAWELPLDEVRHVTDTGSLRARDDGQAFERSLFERVYNGELNGLEFEVACFLDRNQAVTWWYRNVVRGEAYGLQGWKRNRVYPDFIMASLQEGENERWFVLETKGSQLAGNPDTEYKKRLFASLTAAHSEQANLPVGQLEILTTGESLECLMLAEASWENSLNVALKGSASMTY